MLRRLTRERYLTDAELGRFMAAVRDRRHVHQPRDYALFALLANTGIRPSEARAMTRSDVHLGKEPWIQLHRPIVPMRPIPTNEMEIHPEVARVLARYCKDMAPEAKLWPFTKRSSQRLFHYYRAKAGLRPCYRIFTLRHTFGMRLWRHTHDLRIIQAMLGHQRLNPAHAYIHTPTVTVRAVLTNTLQGA